MSWLIKYPNLFLKDSCHNYILSIILSLLGHGFVLCLLVFMSWEPKATSLAMQLPEFIETSLICIPMKTIKKQSLTKVKKIEANKKTHQKTTNEPQVLSKTAVTSLKAQKPKTKTSKQETVKPTEKEKTQLQEKSMQLSTLVKPSKKTSTNPKAAQVRKKEILKYTRLIGQEISKNWKRPFSLAEANSAEVRIKVNQFGDILDVLLLKSSTDAAYDESVIRAIKKSSPIKGIDQMDPELFEQDFQVFKFRFSPEAI